MAAPLAESNNVQNNNHHHAAYASYPDSGDSSPRSRGTDCDNPLPAAAWDDVPPPLAPAHSLCHGHGHHHNPAQRVKFMCSYDGRIQPRAHDNHLSYVGGDTKIVAVERSIRYPQLLARLAALMPAGFGAGDVCFKYQLPGEDLDALISVTNDEDIDHMIVEYDRLQRSSAKPARLRLFLFPVGPVASGFLSSDSKPSDRQWFVDALNSVPAPRAPLTVSLVPPVPSPRSGICNPDFLFGLEKGLGNFPSPPAIHNLAPEAKLSAVASPVHYGTPAMTGLDSTAEESWIAGGAEPPVAHQPEIQTQILELGTLHIGSEQESPGAAYHKWQQRRREGTDEEKRSRGYNGEHCLQPKGQVVLQNAPTVPQIPVAYMKERMLADGGVCSSIAGPDRPVYLIPSPAPQGMYPGTVVRGLTSQAGQGYYAATKQSVAPEATLHQTGYMVAPPPPQPSVETVGAYAKQGPVEANGGIDGNAVAPQLLAAYDSAGRPLYYVKPGPPTGGSVMPAYQTQRATSAVDAVTSGGTAQSTPPPPPLATFVAGAATAQLLNPEGKIAAKPLQA